MSDLNHHVLAKQKQINNSSSPSVLSLRPPQRLSPNNLSPVNIPFNIDADSQKSTNISPRISSSELHKQDDNSQIEGL